MYAIRSYYEHKHLILEPDCVICLRVLRVCGAEHRFCYHLRRHTVLFVVFHDGDRVIDCLAIDLGARAALLARCGKARLHVARQNRAGLDAIV